MAGPALLRVHLQVRLTILTLHHRLVSLHYVVIEVHLSS
jgi:hypothetical protein